MRTPWKSSNALKQMAVVLDPARGRRHPRGAGGAEPILDGATVLVHATVRHVLDGRIEEIYCACITRTCPASVPLSPPAPL